MKIRTAKAFAVSQFGIIGLPTVCYTPNQCRKIAVQTERDYSFPDEDVGLSDSQIWRKLYKQGFRVVPVTIDVDLTLKQGEG